MIRPLTAAAAFSAIPAIALFATPLAAAEIQIPVTGPVVELTVTEQVKSAPDLASVSAGVTTEARTAVEAMRANAREMTAVIARIKTLGIDEDDIRTTGVNLNARFDRTDPNRQPVFRGYQVSNRVSIIVRDVDEIGPILDALVAAGITNLNGPNFSIDDNSVAKAQAREAAMQTAQQRAREYAGWAGFSDIRLLEINETVRSSGPAARRARTGAVRSAGFASTPVQPGLIDTAVTITVKYEMTR